MIVVSNSSPLVALTAINHTHLLPELYGRVIIPGAVWDEVIVSGQNHSGVAELSQAPWLQRQAVTDSKLVLALQETLGLGESEAIVLAVERQADLLLIDERLGRRTAQRFGLNIVGVIGVLIEAKPKGLIPAIKPLLLQLRQMEGFRLSETLYQEVLADEGE